LGFKKEGKKFKRVLHVYVPDNLQPLVEEAKKICQREGESLSKKIVEFCCSYTSLHRHGNPQTLIEKFTQQKIDDSICQMEGCNQKAKYMCYSSAPYGKDRKLCTHHMFVEKRRNNLRKINKL